MSRITFVANKLICKMADLVDANQFSDLFETQLLSIGNELESDLQTLLARRFDPKLWREIRKIHGIVRAMYNELKIGFAPNGIGEKLVRLVDSLPIDHLIAETNKHIGATNQSIGFGKLLVAPKNEGLGKLKTLARLVKSKLAPKIV